MAPPTHAVAYRHPPIHINACTSTQRQKQTHSTQLNTYTRTYTQTQKTLNKPQKHKPQQHPTLEKPYQKTDCCFGILFISLNFVYFRFFLPPTYNNIHTTQHCSEMACCNIKDTTQKQLELVEHKLLTTITYYLCTCHTCS